MAKSLAEILNQTLIDISNRNSKIIIYTGLIAFGLMVVTSSSAILNNHNILPNFPHLLFAWIIVITPLFTLILILKMAKFDRILESLGFNGNKKQPEDIKMTNKPDKIMTLATLAIALSAVTNALMSFHTIEFKGDLAWLWSIVIGFLTIATFGVAIFAFFELVGKRRK